MQIGPRVMTAALAGMLLATLMLSPPRAEEDCTAIRTECKSPASGGALSQECIALRQRCDPYFTNPSLAVPASRYRGYRYAYTAPGYPGYAAPLPFGPGFTAGPRPWGSWFPTFGFGGFAGFPTHDFFFFGFGGFGFGIGHGHSFGAPFGHPPRGGFLPGIHHGFGRPGAGWHGGGRGHRP